MKKLLVTGAGGFIGSYFVQKAFDTDYGFDTWAAVRKSTNREFLTHPGIHFIEFSYHDKNKLREEINGHVKKYGPWDYIIHNMGVTKVLDMNDFEKINYGYTRNFVEVLEETNALTCKFIYMSSLSAAVPDKDQTYYGRSKMMAEDFLYKQVHFPYIIFRPTGVYGPRDKDYLILLQTIQKGFDVAAGLDAQYLSFIHASDLADAVYLALESPIKQKTYNISDGYTYTDKAFTRIAKKHLGKRIVIPLRIPLPVVKLACSISEDIAKKQNKPSTLNRDKYRIMKRRDWSCDITPLKEDLGFEPQYLLDPGLRNTIDWYKKHNWL